MRGVLKTSPWNSHDFASFKNKPNNLTLSCGYGLRFSSLLQRFSHLSPAQPSAQRPAPAALRTDTERRPTGAGPGAPGLGPTKGRCPCRRDVGFLLFPGGNTRERQVPKGNTPRPRLRTPAPMQTHLRGAPERQPQPLAGPPRGLVREAAGGALRGALPSGKRSCRVGHVGRHPHGAGQTRPETLARLLLGSEGCLPPPRPVPRTMACSSQRHAGDPGRRADAAPRAPPAGGGAPAVRLGAHTPGSRSWQTRLAPAGHQQRQRLDRMLKIETQCRREALPAGTRPAHPTEVEGPP